MKVKYHCNGCNWKFTRNYQPNLCPYCGKNAVQTDSSVAEKGGEFTLEEYDADFCRDAAAPHYVRGVPAFMVDDKLVYGLQEKEALIEMIG